MLISNFEGFIGSIILLIGLLVEQKYDGKGCFRGSANEFNLFQQIIGQVKQGAFIIAQVE